MAFQEVIVSAEKQVVTIRLQNGQRLKGDLLSIDADSISWTGLADNEMHTLPLSEIDNVTVLSKNRVSMALLGAAILGAVLTRVKQPECHTDACTIEALGYSYAKLGKNVGFGLLGLLGFSIGQAIEPNEKYIFVKENEALEFDDQEK
ncbi:MAG: hypothetical protein AAF564_25700 [Bacteroidota bacterium]